MLAKYWSSKPPTTVSVLLFGYLPVLGKQTTAALSENMPYFIQMQTRGL
jgi:hypothetical protein